MSQYDGIEYAKEVIADIKAGKMVVLCDDESRENEGDLIVAAEHATPEMINFMATHGRGLICLTLTEDDFERLQIPMMAPNNRSRLQTAFGVSFEAAKGVTTGISAYDRSHSIAEAIREDAMAEDIVMPGHVFPLKAKRGGVLERQGHTEGATDLARLAGLRPAAVLCEIMRDDGEMARFDDIQVFAKKHNLKVATIQSLISYRLAEDLSIEAGAVAKLPTNASKNFLIQSFYNPVDGHDHIAMVAGSINREKPCLLRIHSECLTGDVFGSRRCDCGEQFNMAQQMVADEGGLLIYLRQEGRGIGLSEKIKAYALQDNGLDTVEANQELGHHQDLRDYGVAAQILRSLGVKQVRLLTNNPHKIERLKAYGIDVVERVPLEVKPTAESLGYLKTKKTKLGHLLQLTEEDKECAHG